MKRQEVRENSQIFQIFLKNLNWQQKRKRNFIRSVELGYGGSESRQLSQQFTCGATEDFRSS